jgi:Flp pilus assembly CpaF family ATPase
LDDLLESEETEEIIVVPDEDIVIEKPDTQEKNSKQSSNKKVSNKVTSTKLTQKDQQEAEEIFSILF